MSPYMQNQFHPQMNMYGQPQMMHNPHMFQMNSPNMQFMNPYQMMPHHQMGNVHNQMMPRQQMASMQNPHLMAQQENHNLMAQQENHDGQTIRKESKQNSPSKLLKGDGYAHDVFNNVLKDF